MEGSPTLTIRACVGLREFYKEIGQDLPLLGKPRLVLYPIFAELHCPSGHSPRQVRTVDGSTEREIGEHHDRMGLEIGAELLGGRP